jgi:hypothetical protein
MRDVASENINNKVGMKAIIFRSIIYKFTSFHWPITCFSTYAKTSRPHMILRMHYCENDYYVWIYKTLRWYGLENNALGFITYFTIFKVFKGTKNRLETWKVWNTEIIKKKLN